MLSLHLSPPMQAKLHQFLDDPHPEEPEANPPAAAPMGPDSHAV